MNIAIFSTDDAVSNKLKRILKSLNDRLIVDIFGEWPLDKIKLSQKKYSIVFVDLTLPQREELDLNAHLYDVVFITDSSEYAPKGDYTLKFDYLIKPITKIHVLQVLEKLNGFQLHYLAYKNGAKSIDFNSNHPALILSSNDGFERINVEQIIKIEASKSYSIFYMLDSQKRVSTKNLGYFERLLPLATFIRVHHHCIINSSHIKSYHSSGIVELRSSIFQAVSKRKRHEFLTKFKQVNPYCVNKNGEVKS